MKNFLQRLALRLALAPLFMAFAGLMFTAGHDTAARVAVRSFDGWDCTAKRTEFRKYQFAVPLWLEAPICDQWTRPRQ